MSKSYQMLIASEKANRGVDNIPKLQNLNEALYHGFSEEELQMIFEDLRFFFPDEKIYKRLAIFHQLDIFEGEHFNIKEIYKRKILNNVVKKSRFPTRHSLNKLNHPEFSDMDDQDELHFEREDEGSHDGGSEEYMNPFIRKNHRKIRIDNEATSMTSSNKFNRSKKLHSV